MCGSPRVAAFVFFCYVAAAQGGNVHNQDWREGWRKPDKGAIFVVNGPSGVGKSTLTRMLVERVPHLTKSVSTTTREPAEGEQNGVDYHFVGQYTFEKMIDRGRMLEYVLLYGHHYGTERRGVERALMDGNSVLMELNTQGMKYIHDRNPTDVVSVFLLPPSYAVLRERIVARNREKTSSAVDERMAEAKREMVHVTSYDYVVENNILATAYRELEGIVLAELAKRHRRAKMLRDIK